MGFTFYWASTIYKVSCGFSVDVLKGESGISLKIITNALLFIIYSFTRSLFLSRVGSWNLCLDLSHEFLLYKNDYSY